MAGLWDKFVVPRLIRCACGQPEIMHLRGIIVPQARGAVFELGCGGGINQPLYDSAAVTSFSGIDPSPQLMADARAAAQRRGWATDLREATGEAIPFADASFDTVVTTYTLCSVADPARVLGELRRILRPGGQLLFLEHGRSPDGGVAAWQRRIEPLWKPLMGGCHLTRPVADAISAAGFAIQQRDGRYLPKSPRFAGWMEWGSAIRPA
ncbi:class I SAM-dependent methyltransferase [Novosphingobium sp.]|uniref:class I SAM-dependent methyltransferase n=1 Tax=Novosphingobium sp. TaxID=1874826 RepID=UPI003340DB2C